MKLVLLLSLSLALPSWAEEKKELTPSEKITLPIQKIEPSSRIFSYLNLMKQHAETLGPLGSWKRGEIEIALHPEQIKKIENQTKLRLMSQGISENLAETWSTVGVVAEDNYWIWIRDAVTFPSGVYGTYDRVMWKNALEGPAGVGILAVLSNKKLVVNLNYRHATRGWEIEIPRGGRQTGETPEAAAKRELREETGYLLEKSTLLGIMAPDSGVQSDLVPIFFAEVFHSGETNKEFSEAILDNPAFTKQELKEGFLRGYLEVQLRGEVIKAYCRDPALAYALLQAEGKGLL